MRKPDALQLSEVYHSFGSPKTGGLRPDMLGFLLNLSNVNSESQVMLVEHTRGLIAGAILEREPEYCMRVEFCTEAIKINCEILH